MPPLTPAALADDRLSGRSTDDPSLDPPPCCAIRDALVQEGLYGTTGGANTWRIATTPFPLTRQEYAFLKTLGGHLLAFYRAINQLYFDSIHGHAPDWIAHYLDVGKPESVVAYGRMNRFRSELPAVIRPDLILTDDPEGPAGMVATELDAVPGGIGLTACLSAVYAGDGAGMKPVGGADGMVAGFARMIRARVPQSEAMAEVTLAIVVSDESQDYRPEMAWLARALWAHGVAAVTVKPQEVSFTEAGLWIASDGLRRRVDVLYRFFELFDLPNVPKSELILYAAKKRQVALTPPVKPCLEEKSAYALFHHPALASFWRRQLGASRVALFQSLFPKTWVMDPTCVPPHAVIPDLVLGGQPVSNFRQLGEAPQRERHFVIKPSGFSELAWGARGVSIGQDLPEREWKAVIERALAGFSKTPYLLQKFHKGRKVTVDYYDFETARTVTMAGRARLCPYYFVEGEEATLGGVLATICSVEKKRIHGMTEAVMAPCSVAGDFDDDAL